MTWSAFIFAAFMALQAPEAPAFVCALWARPTGALRELVGIGGP